MTRETTLILGNFVVVEINNWTGNWRVLSSHAEKQEAQDAGWQYVDVWPSTGRYSILITVREGLPYLDAHLKSRHHAKDEHATN